MSTTVSDRMVTLTGDLLEDARVVADAGFYDAFGLMTDGGGMEEIYRRYEATARAIRLYGRLGWPSGGCAEATLGSDDVDLLREYAEWEVEMMGDWLSEAPETLQRCYGVEGTARLRAHRERAQRVLDFVGADSGGVRDEPRGHHVEQPRRRRRTAAPRTAHDGVRRPYRPGAAGARGRPRPRRRPPARGRREPRLAAVAVGDAVVAREASATLARLDGERSAA